MVLQQHGCKYLMLLWHSFWKLLSSIVLLYRVWTLLLQDTSLWGNAKAVCWGVKLSQEESGSFHLLGFTAPSGHQMSTTYYDPFSCRSYCGWSLSNHMPSLSTLTLAPLTYTCWTCQVLMQTTCHQCHHLLHYSIFQQPFIPYPCTHPYTPHFRLSGSNPSC